MASAHHHHSAAAARYSLLSSSSANSDVRLPSLKDLNFHYAPPESSSSSSPVEHLDRHTAWTRSPMPQHPPRHDNNPAYLAPAVQMTSPASVAIGEPSNTLKKSRPATRPSHPAYQQYAHYQPQQAPYPQVHSDNPSSYAAYPQYIPPRPVQQYAPPPQDPWEHHHHQQQQQPQHTPQLPPPPPLHPQQMPYSRTSSLVPPVDNVRDIEKVPVQDSPTTEILKHCSALYSFATRYAQMQASLPNVQPNPAELADMSQRASQVVRLLEDLRRLAIPDSDRRDTENTSSDDHRPPKRPWEDMAQEAVHDTAADGAPLEHYASGDKAQTTAEQDMEIIRSKRATSSASGTATTGQPKSKYRKRSRATPPGKCHSCNIRETPEWRRGPDGARTLCNACGLHYAKLMRKRDKAGPDGQPPRIDMETLRASARAADLGSDKPQSRGRQQQPQTRQPTEVPGQEDSKQHLSHHQGSFQLAIAPPASSSSGMPPAQPDGSHLQQQMVPPPPGEATMSIPPPPWANNTGPPGRGYPEHAQQSFMRGSQSQHGIPPNGPSSQ